MDIFIYSDESGVLDKKHNKYFVFGGLVFLSKESKNEWERRYIHAERVIRESKGIVAGSEAKASAISNKSKAKLFRSLNHVEKFGIVINESKVHDNIFNNKKSKQRYLDWAYTIAVKRKLEKMVAEGKINPNDVGTIHFFVDEHTTATDGKYELGEELEKELKVGMWNFQYMYFHPPVFPNMKGIDLRFCDSKKTTLVRAADIVANRLYYLVNTGKMKEAELNLFDVEYHP